MGKDPADRIRDLIDSATENATDGLADKTGKRKTGMEPSVCVGCPKRGSGPLKRCGLCGCPTVSSGPLSKFGMTPAACPRAAEHAHKSGDPHDFL